MPVSLAIDLPGHVGHRVTIVHAAFLSSPPVPRRARLRRRSLGHALQRGGRMAGRGRASRRASPLHPPWTTAAPSPCADRARRCRVHRGRRPAQSLPPTGVTKIKLAPRASVGTAAVSLMCCGSVSVEDRQQRTLLLVSDMVEHTPCRGRRRATAQVLAAVLRELGLGRKLLHDEVGLRLLEGRGGKGGCCADEDLHWPK